MRAVDLDHRPVSRTDLDRDRAMALARQVRDLEARVAIQHGRAAAEPARLSAAHLDTLVALLHAL